MASSVKVFCVLPACLLDPWFAAVAKVNTLSIKHHSPGVALSSNKWPRSKLNIPWGDFNLCNGFLGKLPIFFQVFSSVSYSLLFSFFFLAEYIFSFLCLCIGWRVEAGLINQKGLPPQPPLPCSPSLLFARKAKQDTCVMLTLGGPGPCSQFMQSLHFPFLWKYHNTTGTGEPCPSGSLLWQEENSAILVHYYISRWVCLEICTWLSCACSPLPQEGCVHRPQEEKCPDSCHASLFD